MASTDKVADGFLTRWSERKLKARDSLESDEPPTQEQTGPVATAEAEEVPVLTDADMPPLESLDDDSDYSGFLSPGVSDDLCRKALSKLFHGARFNLGDGLDDYAEDFTSFLPLGDIVTSDMRHRIEEAAKHLLVDGDGTTETGEGMTETAGSDEPAETPQAIASGEDEERADGEPV